MKKNKLVKILLCYFFVFFLYHMGYAQGITVSGIVKSDAGELLPGVAVVIKGTTQGVTTDLDGKYSIRNVSPSQTLVFSFVGMKTQEILVSKQTNINVVMKTDAIGLDEVIAIGYGVTRKQDLVSSVSSVSSETLQNQPTPRVDQALQGRAAGVEVTSSNGAPGAAATIRIRGTNTINGNNNPLFVIDGFIAEPGFNLNSLNVNDIESIEVLKDATALSIYGTRGAAGVILVTTKSGKKAKSGRPNININHYSSVQSLANKVEVLRGQDYINYKNEESQFVPGPSGFGATDPKLPVSFPAGTTYADTDWLSWIKQTGIIQNTDVSVSGNSENINYYLSINRFDQTGVIKNSGLERYVFRSNMDLNLSKKWKTGVRINISNVKNQNNKVDFGSVLFRVLPIRPVYNADGSYNGINPQSGIQERNPVADINMRQDFSLENEVIGNGYLEYEPITDLKIKSTIGTDLKYYRRNQYLPGQLPERKVSNVGGSATVNQNQSRSLLNENTLTYLRKFGEHSLTFLAGATWQKIINETTSMNAERFVNDAVGFNNITMGSDPATYSLSTNFEQRTFFSLLSRINYSYKSKYLLTLVGRRDGSSVFEEGNKFAFFPSVGGAWNVSEENFMKNFSAISKLKLRGSYGIVGEQGVKPYNSIAAFTGTYNYFNENVSNAVIISKLPSNNLSWETTRQLDLGFELGLYKGRISIEADYYNKHTKDLLLERKVAGTVGSTQLQNIGKIENNGIELSINSVNISKSDFSWETSLSVSANRNKVIDLGGVPYIDLRIPSNSLAGTGIRLMPGHTVPTYVGVTYLGTYKNKEEIIADKMQGRAFIGGPRYKDLDNNGIINDDDKIILGSPQPDFFGGLRNVITYKGFSLDAFIQFSVGNEIFNGANSTAIFGRGEENLSSKVVNRWKEGVNETSDIPRAGTSTSIYNPVSDLWIEDGSFARLKSVTLSYNLPLKNKKLSSWVKHANVYITGNNLLLLTNFSLGDPEVNNYGSGDLEQGVAAGSYPYTTSFTAGVTIDF